MIIFENTRTQKSLEYASKIIMEKLETELSILIPLNVNSTHVSINTKSLDIHTPDEGINYMLNLGIICVLRLVRPYQIKDDEIFKRVDGGWSGYKREKNSIGYIQAIFDVSHINNSNILLSKFKTEKDNMESTFIHELQHAYDNIRSKNIDPYIGTDHKGNPKAKSGEKSGWVDKRFIKHDKNHTLASTDEYLTFSHEINARYAQAIASIKKRTRLQPVSSKHFIDLFIKNFEYWSHVPEDQKRRLLSRAGAEYSEHARKFFGKNSNLTRALLNYDVTYKLDKKFSLIGYWFSDFVYEGDDCEGLVDSLEVLGMSTRGMIALPLKDILKNEKLKYLLKSKINKKIWEKMGKNHISYNPPIVR